MGRERGGRGVMGPYDTLEVMSMGNERWHIAI